MATLHNLLNPASFSLSNVTASNGEYSFTIGVLGMIQQSLPTPVAGHLYYGRTYQLAESGYTNIGDGRFEYYGGDGEGKNIVFCQATDTIKDGQWHLHSAIQVFPSISGINWTLRSFSYNGTANFKRKEHLIIDLTADFGSGNEPSKEWCDTNIPYFVGSYELKIWANVSTKYVKVGSDLPATYRELEYIQSNGSQYIDTGIIPNSNTKIVADFFAPTIDGATMFYGSGVSYDSNNVELYGNSYSSLEVHYSAYYQMTTAVNNRWFHFIQDKNVNTVQVNGSTVATYTFPTKSYSCPYTLYIFALHRASIYNTGSAVRCSKFEMYNNGLLVLNLIPCERVSDGVVGMYDTVSNNFLGNQGSGSFTKGGYVSQGEWRPVSAVYVKLSNSQSPLPSAYQEVEYIQATGTQYIRTGVIGQALWEYDLQYTDTTSRQLMGYGGSASEYWGTTDGVYNPASWLTPSKSIRIGNRDILTQYYFSNNRNAYVNGEYVYSVNYTDVTNLEAQIFAISGSFLNKMKLWSCKVWSDQNKTNLIRDFVPCYRKSDNVIGLYDVVGNQFYTNSGSGTFGKGADIKSWALVSQMKIKTNEVV